LKIQGGGAQIRQFTHARDIARGFELAALSSHENAFMNLVAEEQTTIRQLAEAVVRRLPTELEIAEARAGDVPSATVTSALALDLIGWKAERTLEQGLDEIIAERVR
jgi:UDP-glucose 4-epimerase